MSWTDHRTSGDEALRSADTPSPFRTMRTGMHGVHLYLFHPTAAHAWLAAGGQDGDLMRLAGWRSHSMLSRYRASVADEAYKHINPSDRL